MELDLKSIDFLNLTLEESNSIYFKIVNSRKENLIEGYGEVHHILPRCLGGKNISENLVKLTPQEHFLCHFLLTKIYQSSKELQYALYLMSTIHRYQNSLEVIEDSEIFQKSRINFFTVNSSTRNKKAITKNGKVKYIAKNRKVPDGWKRGGKEASNKNQPLTESHIQKIKMANTGKCHYYEPKTYKILVCNEGEQPEDWIRGFPPAHKKSFKNRPKSKYKGTKYYHSSDGNIIIRCFENEVPDGYLPGRLKNFAVKKRSSSATLNKVRYQNPETKEFKYYHKGKQPRGWILSTYQQELASRKSRYFYDPISHKEKRVRYGEPPPEGWISGRYCYLKKGFKTGSKIVNINHTYKRINGEK